jgi:sulfur carrier protein
MITVTINGEERRVVSSNPEALLTELSLPAPLMLLEHNGKALHRSEWSSVSLADGDRIELMRVAAGG